MGDVQFFDIDGDGSISYWEYFVENLFVEVDLFIEDGFSFSDVMVLVNVGIVKFGCD